MTPHRDEPKAPTQKSVGWTSPWNFDDQWEIDHLRRTPPSAEFEALAKPQELAPASLAPAGYDRGNLARTSWVMPLMMCVGLLGFVLLAWIYLTDAPLQSDADLHLQMPADRAAKVRVPEQLKLFLGTVRKIENMELAGKPAWSWDTPSLSNYVESNGVAFDNLRDLLEDFDWHPNHAAWRAEDLGEHPAWPHVRILLQAQAAYLIRLGNEGAAFTTAIDIAEMSRRMQELWAWPSFMQRAHELHAAAVQTTAELLKQTRLASQSLEHFQNEFMQCEPSDKLLQGGLSIFYQLEKNRLLGEKILAHPDTLQAGAIKQRPTRLFFKNHETLNLFADAFRHLVKESALTPYAARGKPSQSSHMSSLEKPVFYQPNGVGEAYFAAHMEPYLLLPEHHHLAKARHSLVLSLFAIRRYVADHQKLPASLTELYPKYLLGVPLDPFSDEPLQYDPLKGVLFSAGVNFLKEGGRITQPPLLDAAEPTVDLGIAVATPVRTPK